MANGSEIGILTIISNTNSQSGITFFVAENVFGIDWLDMGISDRMAVVRP